MATQPQKNSVLIYESFWLAICDLDVTVQARMFKAIMEYGMYGIQPQLSGIEKSLFVLMKPQIDANITRYNNRKSKSDSQSEETANVTTKKDKTEPTRTKRNKRATNVNANANDNVNVNANANVNESVYVYADNDRDARTHSACEQSEMQCTQCTQNKGGTKRNKRATNANANVNDNVNVNANVNANVNESVYVYDDNDRDARTHSACEQSEMQCTQCTQNKDGAKQSKRTTNASANANDNANVNANVNDNVNANVNESVYVYADNACDAHAHSACEQSEKQCAQAEKQRAQSAHSKQSQQFADISCGAHTLNEKQMGKSCMESTSQSVQIGMQNAQIDSQNAQLELQCTQHGTRNAQIDMQSTHLGTQNTQLGMQNTQNGSQSTHLGTQSAYLEKQSTQNGTNAQSATAGRRSFAYARTQFVKPTLEEVQNYCTSRQNGINAQRFWDYYEARGWMAGNTPIHDWQATVRSWETNTLSSAPQVLSRSFAPYAPNASYAPKKAIVGAEMERRPYTDEDLSYLFTPLDDVA